MKTEKAIERIKAFRNYLCSGNPIWDVNECKEAFDMAIAAMEQKWTPVSEGLPKEHESIWAKAKGTERWSESMWEKQSDEVIVTELFENGTTRTDTACTHDGEWYVKIKAVKRKIIAWMPLPEPWKGEEE